MQFKKSIFLLPVIGCLFLYSSAFAQQYGDFTYTVSGSAVAITGYTGPGGDVAIPDTIDGMPVVSIGDQVFLNNSSLTGATIPGSVTSIGLEAFQGCSNLTGIIIPNSVTSIGIRAFQGCGLTSLTIPDSVTSIGTAAFAFCAGLTSLPFRKRYEHYSYMFMGCSGLTSVTILNGVTRIEQAAFAYCSGLTNAIISNNVTSLGHGSFILHRFDQYYHSGQCYKYWEVGVFLCTVCCRLFLRECTDIGDIVFGGCASGFKVYYRAGATGFTNPWYGYTTALFPFTYTVSAGSVTITGYTGSGGAVVIPDTIDGMPVVTIGISAIFKDSSGLTERYIPSSVTNIGHNAFSGCTGLTSMTIPQNVTIIGPVLFPVAQFGQLKIPSNVTSIPDKMAFYLLHQA